MNLRQFISKLYYESSGLFVPVVPDKNPAAEWVNFKLYRATADPATVSMSTAETPANLISVIRQLLAENADPAQPTRVLDIAPFAADFLRVSDPGALLDELVGQFGATL